jgi:PAS domain S-box-containing protein
VVEDQTEMIVRWRPDGTRTFVNEAYCRSLGRRADELVGKDFFSGIPESRKDAVSSKIVSLTPAAPAATDVHECEGTAGERRWQEWTDRGIFDEAGRLVELLSTGRDVTESREAERRMRQSEERLRRMSEATFEGISITEGGVIVDANEQFARMHGYPLAELIGKPVVELVVPKDRPRVAEAIRHQLAAAYEILGLRKDGSSFPAQVRGRPLELGRRVLRVAAVRDMSEQSELLERLALVGRATNDAVWDWDLRTGELWWSEGIHTLFGYAQRSVRPDLAWWSERIHPEERERVNGGMHAAIAAGGQLWSDEYRFRRADGSYAEVLDRGFVLHGPDGLPLRMVGAMLDITERKGAQEALRRSERMATVGSLVAGVAHEVRTPLFGISANLDAYEGQLHEPKHRGEFVELLRSQVQRLNALMADLLEYGRPQALRLLRGGIEAPIQRALRSCARRAEQAGVTLQAQLVPLPFEVERDSGRLEQVFENLVSNAVAHSPRGGTVRVCVTLDGDGEAPAVRCTVEDEGTGLSPEDLPRLFEPFFSRRKGGTGLGLAIVQRIVEEHGGTVSASNRAGGGAVFSVMLPATAAAGSGDPNSTSGTPDSARPVGSARSRS